MFPLALIKKIPASESLRTSLSAVGSEVLARLARSLTLNSIPGLANNTARILPFTSLRKIGMRLARGIFII
jgi:O-succinylbenzoate synthase